MSSSPESDGKGEYFPGSLMTGGKVFDFDVAPPLLPHRTPTPGRGGGKAKSGGNADRAVSSKEL